MVKSRLKMKNASGISQEKVSGYLKKKKSARANPLGIPDVSRGVRCLTAAINHDHDFFVQYDFVLLQACNGCWRKTSQKAILRDGGCHNKDSPRGGGLGPVPWVRGGAGRGGHLAGALPWGLRRRQGPVSGGGRGSAAGGPGKVCRCPGGNNRCRLLDLPFGYHSEANDDAGGAARRAVPVHGALRAMHTAHRGPCRVLQGPGRQHPPGRGGGSAASVL
mmetsp:Transcript_9497/g.14642  ORF Transcript_9497/g.14642 Transcript_9497/m.14642 type:complete len:219 (+) Transcript_9497:171-827(+)